MPTRYSTPGVYVERFDADPQRLTPRRTDVAGFVGIAARGPLHTPIRIESLRQFTTQFGDPLAFSYLAYAVAGFFANGGRRCWVVRVADAAAARPACRQIAIEGRGLLTLEATSPGSWGNDVEIAGVWGRDAIGLLAVRTPDNREQIVDLDAVLNPPPKQPPATLAGIAEEDLPELTTDLIVKVVPESVWCDMGEIGTSSRRITLSGGRDGLSTLTPQHFTGDPEGRAVWGIEALERIDGVSFVSVPDLHAPLESLPPGIEQSRFDPGAVLDAQIAIIASCTGRTDRVAILDLPRGLTPRAALKYRANFPTTSFAAAYYPWVIVDDPLRIARIVRTVPPSGHLAGVYARSDALRGVQKPPANEVMEGVFDVAETIDERVHGELNGGGINAIRPIPGRGVLVLGARTLDPDVRWRYINVRRLFAYIEEVLDEQMQWAAFEPGNPKLWSEIDRSIRGFLERLYREGKLDGTTPDQAFFVQCDESTNPPWETEAGRVVCLVGIQPPFPAEFVVVRIGVTRSGIELQEGEAQDV
jgi:phage tail sheath protein FI